MTCEKTSLLFLLGSIMDSDDPGWEPSKHSAGFGSLELPDPTEDPNKEDPNKEDPKKEDPKSEDKKGLKRRPEDEAGPSGLPKRKRWDWKGLIALQRERLAILNNESGQPTVAEVLALLGPGITSPRKFFNNRERQVTSAYQANSKQQLLAEFPHLARDLVIEVWNDNNGLFVPSAAALRIYGYMADEPAIKPHVLPEPRQRERVAGNCEIDPAFIQEYSYWRIESQVNQHLLNASAARRARGQARAIRREDPPYSRRAPIDRFG